MANIKKIPANIGHKWDIDPDLCDLWEDWFGSENTLETKFGTIVTYEGYPYLMTFKENTNEIEARQLCVEPHCNSSHVLALGNEADCNMEAFATHLDMSFAELQEDAEACDAKMVDDISIMNIDGVLHLSARIWYADSEAYEEEYGEYE